MQPTVFQPPQLYGSNGELIRDGTYGHETPFTDDHGNGWGDYANNNLEFLNMMATGEVVPVQTLPASGVTSKKYLVTTGDNAGKLYFWTGSAWVETTDAASRAEAAAQTATAKANAAAASATAADASKVAAAGSATAAAGSATDANASKVAAAGSATAAAGSATDANASKVAAAASEANTASYRNAAQQAKEDTVTAAAGAADLLQQTRAYIAAASVGALWSSTTTYDIGDCVMDSNGATYRCIRQSLNNPPSTSPGYWSAFSVVDAKTWELDSNGDLMPCANPVASANWEVDANGDIMPA